MPNHQTNRLRIFHIAAGLAAMVILTVGCSSCGPRMREQISIQPYRGKMPDAPKGTIPFKALRGSKNSPKTDANVKAVSKASQVDDGHIFYGYYCRMCHGVKGDGNGPVGESYVPKPADLSQPAIRKLPDDELSRRMLHGLGHDPVMEQTVPIERRKPIVGYIRTFGADRLM